MTAAAVNSRSFTTLLAKSFLTFDAFGAALFGIVLFFAPHIVGDYVFQRKTDGVHWHLIRCVGGQFFAGGLCAFWMRNSDKTAQTVVHLMRIVASCLLLLLYFHCKSMTPTLLHPTVMDGAKLLCFSGVAVNFFMLFLSGWPLVLVQQGHHLKLDQKIGNALYQLDSIASICIGSAWLAFPKWLLHRQVLVTLDESHELCSRIMGALFVCSFCVAQYALHWDSQKDRRVAINCRVVCCAAILTAQIWSQIAYHDDWSGGHWVGISLYSIWTVLSIIYLLGVNYYEGGDKKKRS